MVKNQKVRIQIMIPEHLLKIIWEERDKSHFDSTSSFLQNLISIGLMQLRNNSNNNEDQDSGKE